MSLRAVSSRTAVESSSSVCYDLWKNTKTKAKNNSEKTKEEKEEKEVEDRDHNKVVVFRIGRDRNSDLVINDLHSSRDHATITMATYNQGYQRHDFNHSGGQEEYDLNQTGVNAIQVKRQQGPDVTMKKGDTLRLKHNDVIEFPKNHFFVFHQGRREPEEGNERINNGINNNNEEEENIRKRAEERLQPGGKEMQEKKEEEEEEAKRAAHRSKGKERETGKNQEYEDEEDSRKRQGNPFFVEIERQQSIGGSRQGGREIERRRGIILEEEEEEEEEEDPEARNQGRKAKEDGEEDEDEGAEDSYSTGDEEADSPNSWAISSESADISLFGSDSEHQEEVQPEGLKGATEGTKGRPAARGRKRKLPEDAAGDEEGDRKGTVKRKEPGKGRGGGGNDEDGEEEGDQIPRKRVKRGPTEATEEASKESESVMESTMKMKMKNPVVTAFDLFAEMERPKTTADFADFTDKEIEMVIQSRWENLPPEDKEIWKNKAPKETKESPVPEVPRPPGAGKDDDVISEETIRRMAKMKMLNKLTVVQLRKFLRQRGEQPATTKGPMLEQLKDILGLD